MCFNFSFGFFSCFTLDIAYTAVGLQVYVITAGIKNYKSIIGKKRKKRDKRVLLANFKLNTIEILISEDLIDSYIRII